MASFRSQCSQSTGFRGAVKRSFSLAYMFIYPGVSTLVVTQTGSLKFGGVAEKFWKSIKNYNYAEIEKEVSCFFFSSNRTF